VTSASAGASRSVRANSFDIRMTPQDTGGSRGGLVIGGRTSIMRPTSRGGTPVAETDSTDTSSPDQAPTEILTFLIADGRGSTLFTQERGDEAAAKLAARFARIVREAVESRGGRLLELRGDEALVVFGSARQAIRAAVDLQVRFVEETRDDPLL